jgi:hypothetical protein
MSRRDNYQARRKELRYLKELDPEYRTYRPCDEAREHIRILLSYGWSLADIEVKSGVDSSSIWDHLTGRSKSIHVDTEAAILGVKLTALDLETGPGLTVEGRALGAHRMVAGLAAIGWTYQAMHAMQPDWGAECFRRYGQRPGRKHSQISKQRYLDLKALAQRLETLDPVRDGGAGLTPHRAVRAKARNKGYAPIDCWDLDTVHLPEAVAEWTGACGTEEGYRIHIRETIEGRHLPLCEPCREVVEVVLPGHRGAAGEPPFEFLVERFREALDRRGINPRQLAIKLGRDPKHSDRFYRWLAGDRQPRNRVEVHAIAEALALAPGDLMRDLRPDEEGKRLIGQQGGFNPFVLRAVAEAVGWTQVRVGQACDVSGTTVAKWIRGEHQPGSKAIIQPLADELGIDVGIFYP